MPTICQNERFCALRGIVVSLQNMPDNHTPAQRHNNMAAIHSASTTPERRLRHALWSQGFRYRVNDKLWHGHKDCKYYTVPKTNTAFWMAKVARNQERDQEVWRKLEAIGWSVIIVWECELKKAKLEETIERVAGEIVRNGEAYRSAQEERKIAREEYRRERRERKEKEQSLLKEVKSL